MEIDYNRLRNDLIDYVGSAMSFFSMATIDLVEIETASEYKLVQIALRFGFNLENYKIKGLHR